jgi:ribosomal protein S18 acetylase RimI-like enzyme
MIIRKGKLSDSDELLKLLNATPELQPSWEGTLYTRNWVRATLGGKKEDLVLIAEENGKIAGFLMAEMWGKKNHSFLDDLFVRAEYRKKKIATKLMDEYERICKKEKLKNIMLLTLTTNRRMQKFIEKRGYKKGNKFYIYEKK